MHVPSFPKLCLYISVGLIVVILAVPPLSEIADSHWTFRGEYYENTEAVRALENMGNHAHHRLDVRWPITRTLEKIGQMRQQWTNDAFATLHNLSIWTLAILGGTLFATMAIFAPHCCNLLAHTATLYAATSNHSRLRLAHGGKPSTVHIEPMGDDSSDV